MYMLPRYKLSPGRRLTYRSGTQTAFESSGGSGVQFGEDSTEWQLFVLEQDTDERAKIAFSQSSGQIIGDDNSGVNISGLQAEGYFTVTKEGQIIENATISPLANPTIVLPELPPSEQRAMNGWASELELDRTQRRFFDLIPCEPQRSMSVRFAETSVTDIDAVYLASRRRSYRFDLARGVIERIDTEFKRNWPSAQESSREVIQLVDDELIESHELQDISISARAYFVAHDKYQGLIDLALWDVAECARLLQEARIVLEAAAPEIRHPAICRWLERKLAVHDQEYENLVADLQKTALAIDRHSPEWAAVDVDGQQVGSQVLRGQVTVLCFWSRGCSWAIRTLAALNSLASKIADRRIVFLGVCADGDEHTVRIVERALGLTFSTVMNGTESSNLAAVFGVEGWPTVVVIDREGVVRRNRAGYWKTMPSMLNAELIRWERGSHYIGC